jgi:hypothetical protein
MIRDQGSRFKIKKRTKFVCRNTAFYHKTISNSLELPYACLFFKAIEKTIVNITMLCPRLSGNSGKFFSRKQDLMLKVPEGIPRIIGNLNASSTNVRTSTEMAENILSQERAGEDKHERKSKGATHGIISKSLAHSRPIQTLRRSTRNESVVIFSGLPSR